MTASEFNTKYAQYLEEGHYGLDIGTPKVVTFLDNAFKDLTKIPGFQYCQIKLKFGRARFYTNLSSSVLERLIEEEINKINDETIIK